MIGKFPVHSSSADRRWRRLLLALVTGLLGVLVPTPTRPAFAASGLSVGTVSANLTSVPLYTKFELTFDVNNTVATNLQFPYDPAPPAGLTPGVGISVQALFLPPGTTDWQQAIVQPGFLYQGYQRQQISGQEWLYPSGSPVWTVRFAPKIVGTWQYQVQAQDASICAPGVNPCLNWVSSSIGSFTATAALPGNHGFVQVSPTDSRYFSFTDGTPFVGLGHQTSFSTTDFTYDADSQLPTDQANGVQLLRSWMSASDIAGSAWNPWAWFGGPYYGYLPDPGIWIAPSGAPYTYTFDLTQGTSSTTRQCIFNGWTQGQIAVKPNTTYQITANVMVEDVTGPANPSYPNYGFTIKVGDWPSSCPAGLESTPGIIPDLQNTGWTTVQGTYTTGPNQNFLGYLFLMLDNTQTGNAHVGYVSMKEVLAGGALGPELLMKSQADAYADFNQARSWDWDYALDEAAQDGVYLKLVVLEKNDRVWNFINWDGTLSSSGGNDNFYATENTMVRTLHQYFWRYLAARWGYSTAVQSWELDNEGDPNDPNHYDQTNQFAAFIHQWDGNHLATTSFWTSYPAQQFWNNASYPNPDYADIHAYTDTSPVTVNEHDAANLYLAVAQYVQGFGVPKPTIRGETGIETSQGTEDPALARDVHGVWLHNLSWARLDSAGMYDLYFYTDDIIANNLSFQYLNVFNFLSGIPFTNGYYHDAQATASATNTRVVGQTDTTHGRAYLWIQNDNHTWWNAVNQIAWGTLTGMVTVPGFAPNTTYPIEWWEFDDPGDLTIVDSTITTDASGNAVLNLATLPSTTTDAAVKIGDYSTAFAQQLSPIFK